MIPPRHQHFGIINVQAGKIGDMRIEALGAADGDRCDERDSIEAERAQSDEPQPGAHVEPPGDENREDQSESEGVDGRLDEKAEYG